MPDSQPHDVIFNPGGDTPIGLMLAREPGTGAAYRIDSSPGVETTEDPVYINGGKGAGFTEQYEPGAYGYGDDLDSMTPGVWLPAGERVEITNGLIGYPTGMRASWEWGSDLYVTFGRAIYKITGGTSTSLALVHDLGSGISAESAVPFDGAIYIGTVDTATDLPHYVVKFNGSTFTTSADCKRRHLQTVQWDPNGVPNHTLVGTSSTYQIRWCVTGANPLTDANWTTALAIGDSLYHIRSLIAAPRHIWAAKQDGVFDIQAPSNGVVHANLTPTWRDNYDIENGNCGALIDGDLYVAHAYGIDMIPASGERQDTPERCEFGAHQPFSGPIYGRPVAMTSWRGWLIVAYYNATTNKSYIMFGHRRMSPSVYGPVEWHGAYSTVTGRVTHLRVHSPTSLTNVYLWIGVANDQTAGYHLYRQYLSKNGSAYQELITGASPRFQTECEVYLADGWDAPTSRRVPYRYDVHADRLGGGNEVAVAAQINRDGSYDAQGTVTTSPRASFIPADVSTSSYRVDFLLTGRGSATNPPIIRAFQPRADVNREQDPVWTLRFWVERHQQTRNGNADTQDPDGVIDALWELQSENATPVTMITPQGNEATVQVMPGITVEERENRDKRWGKLVTLRVRFLYGVWYWDSGVPFDSGRFWS